jgi:nucleoside phosphorylase
MNQDPKDGKTEDNKPSHNSGIINSGSLNNSNMIGSMSGGQVSMTAGAAPAAPPASAQAGSSAQASAKRRAKQFDVCIICALSEEASAVIQEFGDRCEGAVFKRSFSKMTGYEYKYTTITNIEGEELKVLVMPMPFTGPIETANAVRSLVVEFEPRFMAMAGICAGYREKVALGDLVAATYAFSYEEGKVEADEYDHDRFRPEWRTHSAAKRIIQYLQGFKEWLEPVTKMKQQHLGRELLPGEKPRLLVAPVASGMAVQGNNPFPRLLEHNRKAQFLDQEIAAFYQTLNEFPNVFFLAVKGVCDFGDKAKNDDYHDYAARASAIYLLLFMQSYVTNETITRENI